MTLKNLLCLAAVLAAAVPPPGAVGAELKSLTADEKARIAAAMPSADEAVKPPKPRRLLVFFRTEGYVHESIPFANEAFDRLGRATGAFAVETSDEMAVFTPDNLARFDGVLFNNTTQLAFADPAQREALRQFIEERGGGLIGIHAASDNFYEWPEGAAMLGGLFDGHPWTADGTWAVKLDEPDHPLDAPFEGHGFWINDEIYQMKEPFSRERQRVVLSLDMSKEANRAVKGIKRTDGDFPIAWIKRAGQGRVFYCSLGHNPHIYSNPQILRHYLIGIQYALGDRDLPDTPSSTLDPKPAPALAPAAPSP